MIKLNAGLSRKVGEANFSSRGASVNLELEVESSLANDPEGLMSRIRRLFSLARDAVDQELNGGAHDPSHGHANGQANGNQEQPVRYATTSQLRAIRAICNRGNTDPGQLANERFRVNRIEELTVREASALIDELKGTPANRNGGSR